MPALTADTWQKDGIDRIAQQQSRAEKMAEVYEDGFDPSTMYADADGGDANAKAALREYYTPDTETAIRRTILQYDHTLGILETVQAEKNAFAAANWDKLANTQYGKDYAGDTYNFQTQGYVVDMEHAVNAEIGTT